MKSTTNEKTITFKTKLSKECIYYVSLFTLAFAASIALIVFSIKRQNPALRTYSIIIACVFLAALLVSARLLYASVNRICLRDNTLYIKRVFFTQRKPVSDIDSIKISVNEKKDLTIIKIAYGEKAVRFKMYGVAKEDLAELRKIKKSV